MNKIVGYGYRRHEEDLKAIGCEIIWIDVSRERPERAAMMMPGGIRQGDVLRLLAESDLAPPGAQLKKWRAMVEERGGTIEVIAPPKEPKKIGRPRRFDPSPEQDQAIREIWRCEVYTTAYKVRRASEIMGHEVTYHQLYHRYRETTE